MIVGLANHTVLMTKDGSEVPIDDSGAPIRDKDGNTTGVVLVFRDITERKRAEKALRESERRYSALFANKINGMAHCRVITDEHGRPVDYWIMQINEAYEQIIGIKKADIEGRRATEVFPDIKQYAFDYIGVYGKIALEGGEIKFEEYFEATGQYLSIYAYSPLPGEFAAIFMDVTERKEMEEKLRRSHDELELRVQERTEALRRQAELLELAHSAIFVHDLEGRISFWNARAEEMYGWTKAEALGNVTDTLLKTAFPVSFDDYMAALTKEGRWEGELRSYHKGWSSDNRAQPSCPPAG